MAGNKSRDNSGAIWKNKRKEKETHPDFTGEALIGGKSYWVSGWARESQQGTRYTSLAFKPKGPKPGTLPPRDPGSDDDAGDYPA